MENTIRAMARATASFSREIPYPFQAIARKGLDSGTLKPEDFLPDPPAPVKQTKKRRSRSGRPANAMQPFPKSFPAGSGITYDNLYDQRTMSIIGACLERLRESGLFSDTRLEEVRAELMEALPFKMQQFKPMQAIQDARYKFTSTALGNMTTAIFNKAMAEATANATVFLNEPVNGDAELMDVLSEQECPELYVRDKGLARMEALENLEFLVGKMSERDVLLILMHHVLNMTEETMAARLHCSKTAVHKHLEVIPKHAKAIMRKEEA